MTQQAEKLRIEALQLTDADRAELARALISSLESETDEDAEAAWDCELERRLAKIESGISKGRPAEDVLNEVRVKHS
jgi:putative addiction module component (TIGR02574 family)